jgi:hypothetical protein
MFIRWALIALVAGELTLPVPGSAPAPLRYRIEQRTENRLDLSAFGQPEQVQNSAFAWHITISYTDSAGGAVVHAVLDSLQVDLGEIPGSQASIDSAKGTVYHGFANAGRKVQLLTASKPSLYGAQFEGILRSFHPSWRPSAKAGETWTDTLDVKLDTQSIKTQSRSIRSYSMAGPAAWEGTPASKLDVSFDETQTGTLETPGGPAQLEGKTTGTGTWYVTSDGRYLGGKSSSTGDGTVTVAAAPSPIPIKSTTTTSVTLIK